MSFISDLRKVIDYADEHKSVQNAMRTGDAIINTAATLTNPVALNARMIHDSFNNNWQEAGMDLFDSIFGTNKNYGDYHSGDSKRYSDLPQKDVDAKSEEDLAKGQNDAKEESTSPAYDIDEMAGEFILGAWGNGQDRIDNMINAGYTIDDYNKIQQHVNDAYDSGRDLHEWTNKANEKLRYW